MKIYLDNCTFNRPFDDQQQIRIKLESEAKLHVQKKIKNGDLDLVWSYILDFENEQNPFEDRRDAIRKWKKLAKVEISESAAILAKANAINKMGIKAKDALHVACAIAGKAEYLLTTDDRMLKKLAAYDEISVLNPMIFITILEQKI